jgi:hypothetical protein
LILQDKDDNRSPDRVAAVPDLIVREAAIGLLLVAVVMLVAIRWNAPLLEPANPGMSPNPAKAPWYFIGFQELLLHLHPVFAVCIVPGLALSFLLILPFWPGAILRRGIWFGGKRGGRLVLWTFAAGILFTFILVAADEYFLRTNDGGAGLPDTFHRGYIPLLAYTLLLVAGYQILVRRAKFSGSQGIMAGMIFSCAILVAFTIIGIWFRGPGMQLLWPQGIYLL